MEGLALSQAFIRLLLAAALGAAVGLEREARNKPAGLRTIILITFGAALFAILAQTFVAARGGDAGYIVGQLIPGIGFLGAGAILQSRGTVVGLTTAAGIFVMAAVGVACGAGQFPLAVVATLLLLVVLVAIGWVEERCEIKQEVLTYVMRTRQPGACIAGLQELARTRNFAIRDLQVVNSKTHSRLRFLLEARVGSEPEILKQLDDFRAAHA